MNTKTVIIIVLGTAVAGWAMFFTLHKQAINTNKEKSPTSTLSSSTPLKTTMSNEDLLREISEDLPSREAEAISSLFSETTSTPDISISTNF